MERPPIASTSCATATLLTVARPMWLSGMRKALATGLSTPIWWRTRVRSGVVAGSISQTISKGSAPIGPPPDELGEADVPGGQRAAVGVHVEALPPGAPVEGHRLGMAVAGGEQQVRQAQGPCRVLQRPHENPADAAAPPRRVDPEAPDLACLGV